VKPLKISPAIVQQKSAGPAFLQADRRHPLPPLRENHANLGRDSKDNFPIGGYPPLSIKEIKNLSLSAGLKALTRFWSRDEDPANPVMRESKPALPPQRGKSFESMAQGRVISPGLKGNQQVHVHGLRPGSRRSLRKRLAGNFQRLPGRAPGRTRGHLERKTVRDQKEVAAEDSHGIIPSPMCLNR